MAAGILAHGPKYNSLLFLVWWAIDRDPHRTYLKRGLLRTAQPLAGGCFHQPACSCWPLTGFQAGVPGQGRFGAVTGVLPGQLHLYPIPPVSAAAGFPSHWAVYAVRLFSIGWGFGRSTTPLADYSRTSRQERVTGP